MTDDIVATEDDDEEQRVCDNDYYDYIFGFGSIINVVTHAPWISSSSPSEDGGGVDSDEDNSASSLPGRPAVVTARMGYRRGWNFRSNTGFTALGIRRVDEDDDTLEVASDINGVLFRIKHSMLGDFDRREIGYDRVEIPFDCLEFPVVTEPVDCIDLAQISPHNNAKFWIYVPRDVLTADDEHPILQRSVLCFGQSQSCKLHIFTVLLLAASKLR